MNYYTIVDDTYLVVSLDSTIFYETTCDSSHLRDMERIADFERGYDFLALFGDKHTFHSSLDFINSLIDNRVDANIDILIVGKLSCRRGRTYLETNDNSV